MTKQRTVLFAAFCMFVSLFTIMLTHSMGCNYHHGFGTRHAQPNGALASEKSESGVTIVPSLTHCLRTGAFFGGAPAAGRLIRSTSVPSTPPTFP
jgi:hypothetical protein